MMGDIRRCIPSEAVTLSLIGTTPIVRIANDAPHFCSNLITVVIPGNIITALLALQISESVAADEQRIV